MKDAIRLCEHTADWAGAFAREAGLLQGALAETLISTHHIGSTAIPGLVTKPTVDILCVAHTLEAVDRAEPAMRALAYTPKGENGITGRRYFVKRNAHGERTHHVHIYVTGSPHIKRHLATRDFLRSHPEVTAEYSQLKQAIMSGDPQARKDYQNAKAPFLAHCEQVALAWYDELAQRP